MYAIFFSKGGYGVNLNLLRRDAGAGPQHGLAAQVHRTGQSKRHHPP